MSTVAITVPLSASITTILELPLQPLNSRRFFASMARPFGLVPGASGQRLRIFSERASNSAISLELRMLTKMCPLPSATAASGSPPKAIVPATFSEAGSIDGPVVGAVVEGDDALARRVVEDRVGDAAGLDLAGRLQGLEVEDRHAAIAAVAGEALAELGHDRDPVDAGRVGQLADDGLLVEVDHDDPIASRDVEPPRLGVDGEVIPAALAADGDLVDLRRGGGGRVLGQGGSKDRASDQDQVVHRCGTPRGRSGK